MFVCWTVYVGGGGFVEKVLFNNYSFFPLIKLTLVIVSVILSPPSPDTYYFKLIFFPLSINIFLLRNSYNRLHKTCKVSIRWICKNGFYLHHIWQLFLRWYSNCFKQTGDSTVVGSEYTTGRVSILHYYDSPVLEVFPQ